MMMNTRSMLLPILLGIFGTRGLPSLAFTTGTAAAGRRRTTTRLFGGGLLDWREATAETASSPLLLLPYGESDIILPGQSCRVTLREGRHFDLVEDALEDYHSMIGQAVMGEDQLASTVSLCHITDTDVDSEYRGKITMTILLESVGKASLDQLLELKPVPMAECTELRDDWSRENMDELLPLKAEMEEILSDLDDLSSPSTTSDSFWKRYQKALDNLLATTPTTPTTTTELLEASSWAVFAALTALGNSFEPRKALEAETVKGRFRYGIDRAIEVRATKLRQAEQYSLLDDGVFE